MGRGLANAQSEYLREFRTRPKGRGSDRKWADEHWLREQVKEARRGPPRADGPIYKTGAKGAKGAKAGYSRLFVAEMNPTILDT